MKLNRLETHDRLLHFQKQGDLISQGCEECIRNRPKEYGNHPFYIFAHKRELGLDERIALFNEDLRIALIDHSYMRQYLSLESVPTARLIWEPRLTKPKAQSNSMLFRAYPPGDNIKIIWMIPAPELWEQYQKGNMTEHSIVCESIDQFRNARQKLEGKEIDDLSDELVKSIMLEIGHNARNRKSMLKSSEESSTVS